MELFRKFTMLHKSVSKVNERIENLINEISKQQDEYVNNYGLYASHIYLTEQEYSLLKMYFTQGGVSTSFNKSGRWEDDPMVMGMKIVIKDAKEMKY